MQCAATAASWVRQVQDVLVVLSVLKHIMLYIVFSTTWSSMTIKGTDRMVML
jgi:hypothetical protein